MPSSRIPSEVIIEERRELPPVLGGGGGHNQELPPKGYGGGDSGDPDELRAGAYRDRLRRCRLGILLSLISVSMLFVALTTAYLARAHAAAMSAAGMRNPWMHVALPPILAINTIILLISSLTLEVARRKLRRRALFAPLAEIPGVRAEKPRSLPWLAITLVLGFGFLFGQALAWQTMQRQGFYLRGNPASAFFYLLTGAHAVHLSLGLIALSYAAFAHLATRRLETRCLVVDVTSWYWHFMAVLWLYIYALLALA